MILLLALILLFAMMMEESPGQARNPELPPTKTQLVGTAGMGCSIIFWLVAIIGGILASISN